MLFKILFWSGAFIASIGFIIVSFVQQRHALRHGQYLSLGVKNSEKKVVKYSCLMIFIGAIFLITSGIMKCSGMGP
jgi:predicted membrane protein